MRAAFTANVDRTLEATTRILAAFSRGIFSTPAFVVPVQSP